MVPGTTYDNVARAAVGTARNPNGPLCAFCNACLALLVFAYTVAASDSASPTHDTSTTTTKKSRPPEHLPSPADPVNPAPPAMLPPPEGGTPPKEPSAKAGQKPPIQPTLPNSENPSPSHFLPSQQHATGQLPSPSSLPQPPSSPGMAAKAAPDATLEVMAGQTRRLTFPAVPQRVFLAVNENDPIASLREVPQSPREWDLIGKKSGTTYLDVWLPVANDAASQRVLHYVIRIHGLKKERQETITERPQLQERPTEKPPVEHSSPAPSYQALEQEINRTFPGCTAHLKQEGEKLVVSGTARNILDATRILIMARQNAPGTRTDASSRVAPANPSRQDTLNNYAQAGGPQVVNLLRIPGEQQIMLRVVVAEVNRAALRSLGMDFGISDRQATILTTRPAATDGSSTIAHNGWIVPFLKTLQELHYARFLAEPTLTTLNGQAACFQVDGKFPIPVLSPSSQAAVQDVAFQSYGVQLSIQPVIADLDRIRLNVDAEVSGTNPQATALVGGTTVPGLTVRHFQSTVELREGETLALAGLIRGSATTMLPQNIRSGSGVDASADHELVVLISPLLHWPSEEGAGGMQRLNPQDIELYLRSRNTLLPRGDDLYLIGPQGYAGGAHANSAMRR